MSDDEAEMLDQLVLALGVYNAIEEYEEENGELPDYVEEAFTAWREWRVEKGLEKRKERP